MNKTEAFAALALAAVACDGVFGRDEARALRQQLEFRYPYQELGESKYALNVVAGPCCCPGQPDADYSRPALHSSAGSGAHHAARGTARPLVGLAGVG